MGKALKPLIIVLLVLSITSLTLGIMLFSKREVLKGRVQRTVQGIAAIAKGLHDDAFNASQLAVADAASLGQIDTALNRVATVAGNQYDELQNTKSDLESTRNDLAQTRDELSTTKSSLAASQDEVARLNETIVAKEAEVARVESELETAVADKAAADANIESLNGQIATMQDEKRDLEDKVVTLEQTIKQIDAASGEGAPMMQKGLSGQIVVVNKDWNFVVLNIGSDEGVVQNGELLVHRADKLVGKVVVSGVSRNLAIAEIVSDWQQAQIREGDSVVH